MGPTLVSFDYDGLGRLIRTRRHDVQPTPNAEEERYYYDGVRRIREVVDDDPDDPNSPLTAREYVWGPGYVDEALCLITNAGGVAGSVTGQVESSQPRAGCVNPTFPRTVFRPECPSPLC